MASMHRRSFLMTTGASPAALAASKNVSAFEPDPWRTSEVTTRVEILEPSGGTVCTIASVPNSFPYQIAPREIASANG